MQFVRIATVATLAVCSCWTPDGVAAVAVAPRERQEHLRSSVVVMRALAETAVASSSSSSGARDAEIAALLKKYFGEDAKDLKPEEVQDLLKQLNEKAKNDKELADALKKLKLDSASTADLSDDDIFDRFIKYSGDLFSSIGDTLKTFFSGSITPVRYESSKDDDKDDNVFEKMWNSLFGSNKKSKSSSAKSTAGSSSSSSSGSAGVDAGPSSDGSTDELSKSSGSEDTSIDTLAPVASVSTPAPSTTTAKSSSRSRFVTSLPLAGTLAAIVVINFLQ